MNKTLLKYELSPQVTAFSTTRVAPYDVSAEDILQMDTYAAFNVTHYCGDCPKRVERNKQWLCNELGINESQLWLPRQTHTANVRCIDSHFLTLTSKEQQMQLQDIDALITNLPQHCIGVSTADCVPILIIDEKQKAIAAIHAGWRGTVQKIVLNVLQQMHSQYGTLPQNCRAIIGPSISVEAFEVGPEVVSAFYDAGFPVSIVSENSHNKSLRPHIDLWAANAFLLEQAGLTLNNIQIAGICTFNHSDTFFSARKMGIDSGRIFTAIMLK